MPKDKFTKVQQAFLASFELTISKIKEGGHLELADKYKPIYQALMDGNSVLALIMANIYGLPQSYLDKISKLWKIGKIE